MKVKDLTENINFVEKNKQSLLNDHKGKYILVHNGQLIEAFDEYRHAASEGIRRFGLDGNFLVHQLLEEAPLNFIIGAKL